MLRLLHALQARRMSRRPLMTAQEEAACRAVCEVHCLAGGSLAGLKLAALDLGECTNGHRIELRRLPRKVGTRCSLAGPAGSEPEPVPVVPKPELQEPEAEPRPQRLPDRLEGADALCCSVLLCACSCCPFPASTGRSPLYL